jgi:hypothetical protein
MFRKIALRIYRIIVRPAREWSVAANEDVTLETFLAKYFHPLMGIISLSAFAGSFFSDHSLEWALKASIREFLTYFTGFYFASLLLKRAINRWFAVAQSDRTEFFVAYTSSPVYVASIITSLFGAGSQIVYLLVPYIFYILWEGATLYMKVDENDHNRFSFIAVSIILAAYLMIDRLVKYMIITPHAGE